MDKQDQARQVIHLQILSTNQHYYFGSLSAMFEHFDREQLGVAIQTLYNQFIGNYYENDTIVIRKGRLVQKKHKKSE